MSEQANCEAIKQANYEAIKQAYCIKTMIEQGEAFNRVMVEMRQCASPMRTMFPAGPLAAMFPITNGVEQFDIDGFIGMIEATLTPQDYEDRKTKGDDWWDEFIGDKFSELKPRCPSKCDGRFYGQFVYPGTGSMMPIQRIMWLASHNIPDRERPYSFDDATSTEPATYKIVDNSTTIDKALYSFKSTSLEIVQWLKARGPRFDVAQAVIDYEHGPASARRTIDYKYACIAYLHSVQNICERVKVYKANDKLPDGTRRLVSCTCIRVAVELIIILWFV